jgi:hypothetical protein
MRLLLLGAVAVGAAAVLAGVGSWLFWVLVAAWVGAGVVAAVGGRGGRGGRGGA